jgi:hypothetical protein
MGDTIKRMITKFSLTLEKNIAETYEKLQQVRREQAT